MADRDMVPRPRKPRPPEVTPTSSPAVKPMPRLKRNLSLMLVKMRGIRIQNMIEVYGSERIWEGLKQLSTIFGMTDTSIVEALYENYPNLPGLIKKEEVAHEALSQWYEQNTVLVTKFRETSTAVLRANPVIERQVDSSPDTAESIKPIMDLLFRKTEGT